MRNLTIDIETYGTIKLGKAGVYRYAEDDSFDILLFSYAEDFGQAHTIDLANGEHLPEHIEQALTDSQITKWAFNAAFERICLSAWLGLRDGEYLPPEQWRCDMVWAGYLGFPMSLEACGAALQIQQAKLAEGRRLVQKFCGPTTSGRQQTKESAPEAWERFKEYNAQDVRAEVAIHKTLAASPRTAMPDAEWVNYWLDQRINDHGVAVSATLATRAVEMSQQHRAHCTRRAARITGLTNPNNPLALKEWLNREGCRLETLTKKEVAEAAKTATGKVAEVLRLRGELSKSSVAKYQAMLNARCNDGRAHGLLQFYGANRTGRWAGRLIQVQNLPRNTLPDLDAARALVMAGKLDVLEMLYPSVPNVLSELVRTAFIPADGHKFIVADFSAIEARVISWLAGEEWRIRLFEADGDIYSQNASRMFGKPVSKHGENSELRQRGKVSELACIAEGQRVLTAEGLKPIETVTHLDKVWDGKNWVPTLGAIFKGYKEVICYDGLEATPDHLVWVEGQPQPIRFADAAASGAHLAQSGDCGQAIRAGSDHLERETLEQKLEPAQSQATRVESGHVAVRTNSSAAQTGRGENPGTDHRGRPASCGREAEKLARNSRKARVFDLLNTGSRHRFTVEGKLVHNCGYGGSVGALKAMGAVELGVPETELAGLVAAWRKANPKITQMWQNIDEAAIAAITKGETRHVAGVTVAKTGIFLTITLPSGRTLFYPAANTGINRFGNTAITYKGLGLTHRFETLETYGAKLTENIVQAVARDLLAHSIQTLTSHGYRIVMHIHDEVVIEAPLDEDVNQAATIMCQPPAWAAGLPLNADAYECSSYRKD